MKLKSFPVFNPSTKIEHSKSKLKTQSKLKTKIIQDSRILSILDELFPAFVHFNPNI
jgi:hypothetical protein